MRMLLLGFIAFFSVAGAQEMGTLTPVHTWEGAPACVQWLADERVLIANPSGVSVYDIATPAAAQLAIDVSQYTGCGRIASDGRRLFIAQDNTVTAWDAVSGASLGALFSTDDRINRIALSPDGTQLAVGYQYGFSIYPVDGNAEPFHHLTNPNLNAVYGPQGFVWLDEGAQLFVPTRWTIYIVDVLAAEIDQRLDWRNNPNFAGTLMDEARLIVYSPVNAAYTLYDTDTWAVVDEGAFAHDAAFLAESDLLALSIYENVSSQPQTATVIRSAADNTELARIPVTAASLALTPDETLLVGADWDGALYTWAVPSGALLATVEPGPNRRFVRGISPGGQFLLTMETQTSATLWRLER